VKLVHLVGFIIKKFVTMHGHMNVKNKTYTFVNAANVTQVQPLSKNLHVTFKTCH